MKLEIESIPSVVPSWLDPDVPNFKARKDYTGSRIRIKVQISTADPEKELEAARKKLQAKYPGALLNLVQEFKVSTSATQTKTDGTDEELLKDSFDRIELPEHVTSTQF